MNAVNYPASLAGFFIIASAITAFLTDNGWSPAVAAPIGLVAGCVPYVAAKITERVFDNPTEDGPEAELEDPK